MCRTRIATATGRVRGPGTTAGAVRRASVAAPRDGPAEKSRPRRLAPVRSCRPRVCGARRHHRRPVRRDRLPPAAIGCAGHARSNTPRRRLDQALGRPRATKVARPCPGCQWRSEDDASRRHSGIDVFPALDAMLSINSRRDGADQIDHSGLAPRAAGLRVRRRAGRGPGVLSVARLVAASEHQQRQRRRPTDDAVEPDGHHAHSRVAATCGSHQARWSPPRALAARSFGRLPAEPMPEPADELRASLQGLHARISSLLVRL